MLQFYNKAVVQRPKGIGAMKSAFLVQHVHILPSGKEDVKTIGIYSSEMSARDAIKRLKDLPGFVTNPKVIDPAIDDEEQGFVIDEYTVDKDQWAEGFITMLPNGEEYES